MRSIHPHVLGTRDKVENLTIQSVEMGCRKCPCTVGDLKDHGLYAPTLDMLVVTAKVDSTPNSLAMLTASIGQSESDTLKRMLLPLSMLF